MTRGGANRGQGRRPLQDHERRVTVGGRVNPELVEWMDRQTESRSKLIELALKKLREERG